MFSRDFTIRARRPLVEDDSADGSASGWLLYVGQANAADDSFLHPAANGHFACAVITNMKEYVFADRILGYQ